METASAQPTTCPTAVPVLVSDDTTAKAAKPTIRARVLHVINGEHFSGAERVQDLLASHLPAEGFEVAFACVKPDRFAAARTSSARLFETPMRNRFDITAAHRIAKIVKQQEYSLLHAHTPRSALVASLAARITGVPMVYHVHSPTSRDSTAPVRNWVNAINERFSLWGNAGLLTVSHSLGSHMRSAGYRDELITVVPNGVPAPDVRRSDQAPASNWTLGTVALFRPRKGLEVLLLALAILRDAGLPVRLRAIGPFETDEYEASIRRMVQELRLEDAIDWVGFTKDVPQELTQLDLFVLPSLFGEGLPMVVLEAMAAGVPVLATRVEGVPEAIEHGRSGLLAQPGDAEDLAQSVRDLVEGKFEWTELRQAALTRHAEFFSERSMAKGVAEVYRRVLDLG